MSYNFKTLKPVIPSKDLINVILSKTQRKTPTVVHPGYSISRIRAFYCRKIKFTQESIQEKLTEVLQGFPKLDDIHPFYGDLINVLYDKDHYKLALGHIHSCKTLVDNISSDYLKLLKYADSLYRCKMLKKAALGRMCTGLKKLTSSLNYLEEVRKHLSRLPQINPYERTILITGYPNVGKSSFINNITKANVEVQSYAFTTKSLYVGHTEFNNIRHQVIDTPGLLDSPLESKSTIEMQSITALAHLKAVILFFVDISEECSYSIASQLELYQSIKPLFKNKPVCLVLTKTDIRSFSSLQEENQTLIKQFAQQENLTVVEASNKSGEGIENVKNESCKKLEDFRKTQKPEAISGGNNMIQHDENVNRGIYIAYPKAGNNKSKPQVSIPKDILDNGRSKINRPTLKEIAEENGGAGVFTFPLNEHFMLKDESQKYDIIPEIMDGKNIKDFVDADILQKLQDLEQEEQEIQDQEDNQMEEEDDFEQDQLEQRAKNVLKKVEQKKKQHQVNLKQNTHRKHVKLGKALEDLKSNQLDTSAFEERIRSKSKPRTLKQKWDQYAKEDDSDNEMNMEDDERSRSKSKVRRRLRSHSRSRSKGFQPPKNVDEKTIKIKRRTDRKWDGRAGEADRSVAISKPRHLYSGKRSNGSNDRR